MRPSPRRFLLRSLLLLAVAAGIVVPSPVRADSLVDLRDAVIVVTPGERDPVERTAVTVLQEEVQRRTGRQLRLQHTWPTPQEAAVVIAVSNARDGVPDGIWPTTWPLPDAAATWRRPDGYRVAVERGGPQTVLFVTGADPRGTLYAVGEVLRALRWSGSTAGDLPQGIPATLDVSTAPEYAIRGHQLGYRATANSYDGWTVAQYEQYIRELALFGVNAIENIPFQDTRESPHFPVPRDEMTRAVSDICARYGLEYWLWVPADFDLLDTARRSEALDRIEAMARDLPRLDAIFVPGGDPGHNPAPLVFPYLRDIATRIRAHHPEARVWVSLQQFGKADVDWVFETLGGPFLEWFGGLVGGPSSPPLDLLRERLPRAYPLRDYPDVTHVVRAQYPLVWDPAFAFTLGREPINPRPTFYAALHDRIAGATAGAITYSDGAHDDVNKVIWSQRAWSSEREPMTVLRDYTRFFFGQDVADAAADGIAALERNWEGPLQTNTQVPATLAHWQALRRGHPHLADNWRWQMLAFRASYDAYVQQRQQQALALEGEATAALRQAGSTGAAAAASAARAALARQDTEPCCVELRRDIEQLAEALFASVRLQTSVERYGASGAERGAVLDFLDHPLNDRWWLEDQLTAADALPDEAARVERLVALGTWTHPGPGSTYDDIGNIAASPHVVASVPGGAADAPTVRPQTPHFSWEEQGRSRKRLAWLTSLRWPRALHYTNLDPAATYVLRLAVTGDVRPRVDGVRAEVVDPGAFVPMLREVAVPASAVADGELIVTFDDIDESDRNWRQYSRLHEVWIIKR